MEEEYEGLVAAIFCIDALLDVLEGDDDTADDLEYLYELRNRLNVRRLVVLGGGEKRPFHVSDLNLT